MTGNINAVYQPVVKTEKKVLSAINPDVAKQEANARVQEISKQNLPPVQNGPLNVNNKWTETRSGSSNHSSTTNSNSQTSTSANQVANQKNISANVSQASNTNNLSRNYALESSPTAKMVQANENINKLNNLKNSKPVVIQKPTNEELVGLTLKDAYAKSGASKREIEGEETKAQDVQVQQTGLRFVVDDKHTYMSAEPQNYAEKVNQARKEDSQKLKDYFNNLKKNQNEVTLNGNYRKINAWEKIKDVQEGLETLGRFQADTATNAAVRAGKGVASGLIQVANVPANIVGYDIGGQGNILTNIAGFFTSAVTEPKKTFTGLKNDFLSDPIGFTAEQYAFGKTAAKTVKATKTGEILEIVKPTNIEGAFTARGSLAETGQRLYASTMNGASGALSIISSIKNAEFDMSKFEEWNKNLGINKKGQVNNPNGRRISKAEQRYQSRTGFTKSFISKGERPGQQGTSVQSFTYKDIMKNQELQGQISQFQYPDNLGEYKKFSIIRDNENSAFTAQKRRDGYSQFDLKIVDKNKAQQQSSQSTTKKLGYKYIESGNKVLDVIEGNVKITYQYIPKKPTLEPRVVEPKKIDPSNIKKYENLVSNLNDKGQEVYAPANEPINVITKGFRNEKIRQSLFNKMQEIKQKREIQLKEIANRNELQRQQDTLPIVSSGNAVRNQAKNTIYNFDDNPYAIIGKKKKNLFSYYDVNNEVGTKPTIPIGFVDVNSHANLPPKQFVGIEPVYIDVPKVDSGSVQNALSLQRSDTKSDVSSLSSQDSSNKVDYGLFQGNKQSQNTQQLPEYDQPLAEISMTSHHSSNSNISKYNNDNSNITENNEPIGNNIISEPSRSTFSFEPQKPRKLDFPKLSFVNKKQDNAFLLQVRKGGKFVNMGMGSMGDMMSKGSDIVRGSSAASFRVLGGAGYVQKGMFAPTGFYSSNKEPGVFIEKNKFRINTGGEVSEISYKGLRFNSGKKKKGLGEIL